MESSQVGPATEEQPDPIKAAAKELVPTAHKRRISIGETDTELYLADKGAEVRESDFKRRQVRYSGRSR
jgi:hypothetical protein